MNYQLPKLNYTYDALEPHMDARTVELHYTKHHQAYVSNLNKAIEGVGYLAPSCPRELISNLSQVPEEIRTAVRNNGGGHVNHTFFWEVISPNGGEIPKGVIAGAIDQSFHSFESFKEAFTQAAMTHFASGWVWLCAKADRSLHICSTPNHDSPLMAENPMVPLLVLDLWEHAYYLKHQNRRADYIKAFWNIVNWEQVDKNYKERFCM